MPFAINLLITFGASEERGILASRATRQRAGIQMSSRGICFSPSRRNLMYSVMIYVCRRGCSRRCSRPSSKRKLIVFRAALHHNSFIVRSSSSTALCDARWCNVCRLSFFRRRQELRFKRSLKYSFGIFSSPTASPRMDNLCAHQEKQRENETVHASSAFESL